MKKTIKEDKERIIIKEEFINDNTLLEYVKEDNNVIIGIRYIESPIGGIKENILVRIKKEDFTDIHNFFKIDSQKSTIAIFNAKEDGYQLTKVYDIEEHSLVSEEFMDIVYNKKFPKQPLDKHLVLRK